jgi:hypothetical protein
MNDKEERSASFTVRADSKSRSITGTAAVYDTWTTIGGGTWGFREKIDERAFDDSIKNQDIVATFNHDFNMPMARTESKTLEVWSNAEGLHYRFDAPNTTAGNDLLENVRNGNILGGSIMFSIDKEEWKWSEGAELDERVINGGTLFEMGPVTMPAYKETSVSARSAKDSYDATLTEAKQKDEDAKALTMTLQLKRKRNSTK